MIAGTAQEIKRTVMIIDDEPSVIKGLIEHIPWTDIGLTVEMTAADGAEAWEQIRLRQPDIVMTDVYMPRMDGLTLIKKIYEQYPQIHVVIHSGYDEFDNARLAMRYGVQHFLLKPSTVSEITAVLQDCIQETIVQDKQQKLLARFEEQQQSYLYYAKDAMIREMLVTRYESSHMLREKLQLLQLSDVKSVVVASVQLMRPL